jgi:hypothetical protein
VKIETIDIHEGGR